MCSRQILLLFVSYLNMLFKIYTYSVEARMTRGPGAMPLTYFQSFFWWKHIDRQRTLLQYSLLLLSTIIIFTINVYNLY